MALLLLFSQAANTAGFLVEWASSRKKGSNPCNALPMPGSLESGLGGQRAGMDATAPESARLP